MKIIDKFYHIVFYLFNFSYLNIFRHKEYYLNFHQIHKEKFDLCLHLSNDISYTIKHNKYIPKITYFSIKCILEIEKKYPSRNYLVL